jgi:hypothetical protein
MSSSGRRAPRIAVIAGGLRDAAPVNLGLGFDPGGDATPGASYAGGFGTGFASQAARQTAVVRF